MTTTVPLPDLDMPFDYYGVRFSPAGEDADILIALGHVEPRRALAAFNRYFRSDCGLAHWADDPYADAEKILQQIKHRWAVQMVECGQCDPDVEECPQCQQIKAADWWLNWAGSPLDPGSFPVTVWAG